MTDYELLDFGNGRRLERFGSVILDRLCPAAECQQPMKPIWWSRATARFDGQWTTTPDPWLVSFDTVQLELRCTPFGHIGVFPEQMPNWKRIETLCRPQCRILNLFAYTGGSSIAAAKSAPDTEIVHVDSAKGIVDWAKRNAVQNGIGSIRFIVEDVRTFVRRELKRGNRYDAVILDPPSYGHGVKGETWKLADDLPMLLTDLAELLTEEPLFFLLTAHTQGFDGLAMQTMLRNAGVIRSCFRAETFTMPIPAAAGNRSLETGCGFCLASTAH
jgi:23S rRNA (cytosine1962-C5)-methyltransferase